MKNVSTRKKCNDFIGNLLKLENVTKKILTNFAH
jgi:hypothetical protein